MIMTGSICLGAAAALLVLLPQAVSTAADLAEQGHEARTHGLLPAVFRRSPLLEHSGNAEFVQRLDADSELTFIRLGDGIVAITELTLAGRPSALAEIDEQTTPLALYLSLGGRESEAPSFLRDHHVRVMAEADVERLDRIDLVFSIDTKSRPIVASGGSAARALRPVTADLAMVHTPYRTVSHNKGLYKTDCSGRSDGNWFDRQWQSRKWKWHWYYSGEAQYKSTPSVFTDIFWSHLCNHRNGPNQPRHVVQGYPYAWVAQYVPMGYRSWITIRTPPSNTRLWRGKRISDNYVETGHYRLGAIAPP
jgi:hypothetical protein